jgi:hypothetical protein
LLDFFSGEAGVSSASPERNFELAPQGGEVTGLVIRVEEEQWAKLLLIKYALIAGISLTVFFKL